MNRTRSNWLFVGGVALVVIGGIALADRVLGTLWRPVAVVLSGLSHVAWPLVLVVLGVMLMSRSRGTGYSGDLRRSRTDRVVGGVIGGIAERLGSNSNVLRGIFVAVAILSGVWAALLLYLIALVAIPEASVYTAPSAQPGPAPVAPPVPPAPPAHSAPCAPVAPPVPASPAN